jgi:hypothetical protein
MRRIINLGVLFFAMAVVAFGQNRPAEHFSAMAVLPPSAVASSTVPLNIDIQAYTSDATLNALGDILSDGNNQAALLQRFQSMPGIGDVSREGRVGVQVKAIRVQQTPQGLREITMLTDRPIHFWEVAHASPTENYPYGMIQFTVDHNGNGTGKAYPVVKIKSISANNIAVDDYGAIPIELTIHQIQ